MSGEEGNSNNLGTQDAVRNDIRRISKYFGKDRGAILAIALQQLDGARFAPAAVECSEPQSRQLEGPRRLRSLAIWNGPALRREALEAVIGKLLD
ncbi:hypothetical protein [Sphingomonas sp. PAMC 26621]|uniref:hypothetical protein n=1 Tax=Sphingomonas sp. PAMC 26621 TaxID=1112213 RepID=UPI0014788A13|nr:hypothetical protein [Sphingomonas sp. PAMC 26621]